MLCVALCKAAGDRGGVVCGSFGDIGVMLALQCYVCVAMLCLRWNVMFVLQCIFAWPCLFPLQCYVCSAIQFDRNVVFGCNVIFALQCKLVLTGVILPSCVGCTPRCRKSKNAKALSSKGSSLRPAPKTLVDSGRGAPSKNEESNGRGETAFPHHTA